ncbi:outer membrane beta-barrel protein [Alteromonas pelagimontana]|uniref:Outer membrane beta-barrel protein n=1 Tax=Alteromonas pelagimontana TaxID=1858656 RepID=A0A6M4MFR5_9ALTE|nr:outer membrane beta-barrel protein [Alteromonas pelagimontana]QJR81949.1 outer membrane beta-barrel protein [Alteromonas pelagimontana]
MKKRFAALGIAAGLSLPALATENMYGVIGTGYSDIEFSQQSADKANYHFALAHQFARSWYAEVGYQRLADNLEENEGMKADALYLAVLGKASAAIGELYYKLGIMNVDVKGIEGRREEGGCALGGVTVANSCEFDEGVVAGMVGFGFDYHLGLNTMFRIEATHVRGEHDLAANLVNVGIRYNFN